MIKKLALYYICRYIHINKENILKQLLKALGNFSIVEARLEMSRYLPKGQWDINILVIGILTKIKVVSCGSSHSLQKYQHIIKTLWKTQNEQKSDKNPLWGSLTSISS